MKGSYLFKMLKVAKNAMVEAMGRLERLKMIW
jgi:hypothetical protein